MRSYYYNPETAGIFFLCACALILFFHQSIGDFITDNLRLFQKTLSDNTLDFIFILLGLFTYAIGSALYYVFDPSPKWEAIVIIFIITVSVFGLRKYLSREDV
jgi:predicted ABC-type exoprotein transport system permease subunit